jgi:hypothetical protein
MTYIERDFKNLAIDGQNDGKHPASLASAYADDTEPYKLRGAYSDGLTQGVFIPSLNLHHSFSVTFWAYSVDGVGEHVLFSKDKGGNYDTPNTENFLDIASLSNGVLAAFLYQDSNDKFNSACKTPESAITTNAWYYIAYTFDFNGEDTLVTIYVDGTSKLAYNAEDVFILDKSSYTQAWLFMSTASSAGDAAVANAWNGFIYWFTLDQDVLTANEIANGIQTDGALCSLGTACDKCPTVNGNKCLWTVERDQYVNSSGNAADCDNTASHEEPLCLNDVGCVREEDCNRCNDRICLTCINFDEGAQICETCKSNASNGDGSQVCECITQTFFDEGSDACENCNSACDECPDFGDSTNKSCTECQGGYYLHPDSATCLDFCPTGFSENGNACEKTKDL